jgi:hypothetical protein
MPKLSRQRLWQINNPVKEKAIRQKTKLNARAALLKQGIVKTHEEIWDMIRAYELRRYQAHDYDDNYKKVSDEQWWLIYEYIDWKYNGTMPTPAGAIGGIVCPPINIT